MPAPKQSEQTEQKNSAVELVAALKEAGVFPEKKVTLGNVSVKSAFNPRGIRNRKIKVAVYQNGDVLRESKLTDEEIAIVNQMGAVEAGNYCNGRVTVKTSVRGKTPHVYIDYKAARANDRTKAYSTFAQSLSSLLQRIIDESKADAEAGA
jgi:hypothetical protein